MCFDFVNSNGWLARYECEFKDWSRNSIQRRLQAVFSSDTAKQVLIIWFVGACARVRAITSKAVCACADGDAPFVRASACSLQFPADQPHSKLVRQPPARPQERKSVSSLIYSTFASSPPFVSDSIGSARTPDVRTPTTTPTSVRLTNQSVRLTPRDHHPSAHSILDNLAAL